MRVLHLTDPHLFADPGAALRGTVTFESLQKVLRHYREASWKADVVVLSGDVAQDESAAAYRHIESLLKPLALPVLVVPGNHDARPAMQTVLGEAPFHYCGALRLRRWLLIGLDSCVNGAAHGELSASELERLGAEVATNDAAHVLVCLHHPPVDVGSRWLDGVGLRNAEAFLREIGRAQRVRCILFGHVHQSVEQRIDNVEVLGTPSTCRQFKPQNDEFALDDRPPAYRQLELGDDGQVNDTLVWVAA